MKKMIILLLALLLVTVSAGCSSSGSETSTASKHVFDDAEIVDVLSGSGTEVIGKCSVSKAWTSDVTDDTISDWYFNHVEPGGYNWAVIVYLDRPGLGVYGANGIVEKDVLLKHDDDGSYYIDSDENAVILYASDGKLVELSDN